MIEFSSNYQLSIYDASYLALTHEIDGEFITADLKIKRNVPKNIKKCILNLHEIENDTFDFRED